jgi:hypothetical protein
VRTILVLMAVCGMAQAGPDEVWERTADAICQVESGGGKDKRDGDGGKAIGPYQIHRAYWADGTRVLGVDWAYEDARDMHKARAVAHAYTRHYARHYKLPWTPETIARIHNGGPVGWKKAATLPYWARVREAMKR